MIDIFVIVFRNKIVYLLMVGIGGSIIYKLMKNNVLVGDF